jgi:hypothetical protein
MTNKTLKKEASSRQTPLDFYRYIYGGQIHRRTLEKLCNLRRSFTPKQRSQVSFKPQDDVLEAG